MRRSGLILRLFTIAALVSAGSSNAHAQTEPESHVLFSFDRKQGEDSTAAAEETAVTQAVSAPLSTPVLQTDKAVIPAAHEKVVAEEPTGNSRRLEPMTRKELLLGTDREPTHFKRQQPFEVLHLDSLGTAGAGLVLVVGLFLLCVALMRRGGPSPTSPLPRDAVAVLGRVPLMPKQFAHLLQVGNKLVLVSISGDRTDTITEITEPTEVDRMLALCMKSSRQGSSADFQRVLGQMAKEPTRGFLGREATYSRSTRG